MIYPYVSDHAYGPNVNKQIQNLRLYMFMRKLVLEQNQKFHLLFPIYYKTYTHRPQQSNYTPVLRRFRI